MKKLTFVAIVALLVLPAYADVNVTASAIDTDVTVQFNNTYTGDGNNVRAFALEISLNNGAVITDVNAPDSGYWVYPGSIVIDANGDITDEGSAVCDGSYPGTPAAADVITVEMGSLYEKGVESAPDQSGTILTFTVDCNGAADCNVTISENAIRGGVVMEDPEMVPVVNLTGCPVVCAEPPCYTGADFAEWQAVGEPNSWCNNRQCRGDADANDEPYGPPHLGLRTWVGNNDIAVLIAGYKVTYNGDPETQPWISADFDHADEPYGPPHLGLRARVGNNDIAVLVNNYKTNVPADCGQTAP